MTAKILPSYISLFSIPCSTKFLRVLIFAIFAVFPAIHKNKFPQIEVTAHIFLQIFTAE